ncbi:MAG: SDR family oxidoreductase [Chthoniobacterales bacterium]
MSTLEDPRELYPKPPFSKAKQPPPGSEEAMDPPADHGESTYRGTGRLEGRKALVTGADSGIGRAVAIAFAREGADVAIAYLEEDDDARETGRLVREAGREAVLVRGDLESPEDCQRIAEESLEALGCIDILVNNAAYQRTYSKLEEIPDDEFERHFAVNIFGMFRLCKRLLPQMPAGGVVINTASIQSVDPSENLLPYAATKAAIASFTKSLASLAMKQGVRVNAVAPGPVWTPLIPSTMPAEKASQFGANTIFERPGQPAEMAPIFVFLASNEASYVSGEIYGATGAQMPI